MEGMPHVFRSYVMQSESFRKGSGGKEWKVRSLDCLRKRAYVEYDTCEQQLDSQSRKGIRFIRQHRHIPHSMVNHKAYRSLQ